MIKDIIQKDLVPAHIEDLGIHTLAKMEEYKTSNLPVVNSQNKLIGIIDENTILNMEDLESPISFLKKYMENIYTILDSHIFESLQIIADKKLVLLPVVNHENYYIGYITPVNIITKISQVNQHYSNIKIIVISIQKTNYILSEISRLIEENNGAIITLWQEMNKDQMYVHILIRCDNHERIIKTLERYDYRIHNTFVNNVSNKDLDNRFESFIKYLNP